MKRYIWLIITLIWLAFIFYNSSRIGQDSSLASGKVVMYVQKVLNIFKIEIHPIKLSYLIRKGAHFFEYFMLAIFSYNFIKGFKIFNNKLFLYDKITVFSYLIIITFCLFIAIIDELIQYFTPGRVCSIFDVMIDVSGSVFAINLIIIFSVKKIKSTLNNANKL